VLGRTASAGSNGAPGDVRRSSTRLPPTAGEAAASRAYAQYIHRQHHRPLKQTELRRRRTPGRALIRFWRWRLAFGDLPEAATGRDCLRRQRSSGGGGAPGRPTRPHGTAAFATIAGRRLQIRNSASKLRLAGTTRRSGALGRGVRGWNTSGQRPGGKPRSAGRESKPTARARSPRTEGVQRWPSHATGAGTPRTKPPRTRSADGLSRRWMSIERLRDPSITRPSPVPESSRHGTLDYLLHSRTACLERAGEGEPRRWRSRDSEVRLRARMDICWSTRGAATIRVPRRLPSHGSPLESIAAVQRRRAGFQDSARLAPQIVERARASGAQAARDRAPRAVAAGPCRP
jgi:hypothetical protein